MIFTLEALTLHGHCSLFPYRPILDMRVSQIRGQLGFPEDSRSGRDGVMLTKSIAYETRRFNAAFTRALQ